MNLEADKTYYSNLYILALLRVFVLSHKLLTLLITYVSFSKKYFFIY